MKTIRVLGEIKKSWLDGNLYPVRQMGSFEEYRDSLPPDGTPIQIEISPAGSPTREELIESVRALALCGTFDAKGNPIVCAPNIGEWMQASILCKRFLGNPSSKTPQPADQKCSTSVLYRENPPDSGDA